jgi:hypothetical protein
VVDDRVGEPDGVATPHDPLHGPEDHAVVHSESSYRLILDQVNRPNW